MKSLRKILPSNILKQLLHIIKTEYWHGLFSFRKSIQWYKASLKEHDFKISCDYCEKPILIFDDCGFFYPDGKRATCGCIEFTTGER